MEKSPGYVKFSLKLSDLKPSHAKWVVEMYKYLKQTKEFVIKGFEKTGIMEAAKSAQDVYTRCENPLTISIYIRSFITDCIHCVKIFIKWIKHLFHFLYTTSFDFKTVYFCHFERILKFLKSFFGENLFVEDLLSRKVIRWVKLIAGENFRWRNLFVT